MTTSREQLEAQIKAAAWAAVAALGVAEASRMLSGIQEEIARSQWNRPGDR